MMRKGCEADVNTDATTTAPRAAYVILSHRRPAQVERLVHAILRSSPHSYVVVCHDNRRAPVPVIDHPHVHVMTHRNATDWGSWEIVHTTIEAFRLARDLFDPDLVALLSGQDYPVRNLAEWELAFLNGGGGWVGTSWPLRYTPRWGKPYGEGNDELTRYIYRWYRFPFSRSLATSQAKTATALRWIVDKLGHYLEPVLDVRVVSRGRGYHFGIRSIRTPFARGNDCYRGSQWVALDRKLLQVVLDRHDHDRLLRRTYRRSIIPDESYIQTILTPIAPPVQGPPLTYVEWVVKDDAPLILTLEELETIQASGSPFCRKVEPGLSDGLLDRLDQLSSTTEEPHGRD